VDYPWYPADLREGAIADLVSAFTSTMDNWLYWADRYPQAHSMEYVLRPGERLIRYFMPESEGLFYLPFKFAGKSWAEFPRRWLNSTFGPWMARGARKTAGRGQRDVLNTARCCRTDPPIIPSPASVPTATCGYRIPDPA
jgi:hypothetical protein